jgi:hypothetical protein
MSRIITSLCNAVCNAFGLDEYDALRDWVEDVDSDTEEEPGTKEINIKKYIDPLYETFLFRTMNPMFRMMHSDIHNVFSIVCYLLAIWCDTWARLGFGLLGLAVLAVKHYLICGPCIPVYTTNRVYGSSTLTIDEGIATLCLNEDTYYENGVAQGYILCEEIIFMINRFKLIVRPRLPAWFMKNIIDGMESHIANEMRGIYDIIKEKDPTISFDDLVLLQLAPDLGYMACTCYAVRENGQIVFGRNMDWIPFSSAQYSLIVRYVRGGFSSLTVPGLIGCVTAWRDNYILAMNVVGSNKKYDLLGTPSTLLNRRVIHNGDTYEMAIYCATEPAKPAVAYHLTIANKKMVKCVSFRQTPDDKPYVRSFTDDMECFTTLNWSYPDNQMGRYISAYRNTKTISKRPVKDVLCDCQTFETAHSLIMNYNTNDLTISIDNGYAADHL